VIYCNVTWLSAFLSISRPSDFRRERRKSEVTAPSHRTYPVSHIFMSWNRTVACLWQIEGFGARDSAPRYRRGTLSVGPSLLAVDALVRVFPPIM
jgi:hypothetical protein